MKTKPQNRNIIKTLTPKSKLKPISRIQGMKAVIKQSLVISALARKGLAEQENSGKSKPTAKTHREIKQAIAKLGKIISALTRK